MPSVKPVTLKDVAERAKVSQSVVSTVLNERQNGIFVSDGTRQNVLAAAAHLGYIARHRALPPIRKPRPRAGPARRPSRIWSASCWAGVSPAACLRIRFTASMRRWPSRAIIR